MSNTITPEQKSAALTVMFAIADAIKASEHPVPEGPLYAVCMRALSLEQFQQIIGVLISSGMVRRKYEQLEWIGPR